MPAELFTTEPLDVPAAILRVLSEAGIDHIFGMPGGHTGRIYNALEAYSNAIRTVLVREESLAGVMAEVTGRLSGKPGVIMGQGAWVLGHGIIGTLEALLSSSPMLLISELSDSPGFDLHAPYQAGTGDYGVWNAQQAFSAICKQVFVVRDAVTAVHAVQLAIKHALSGQQGPVAVLLSRSALSGKVGPDSFPKLYKTHYYLPPAPPPAEASRVADAAAAVRAAKNAVVVAGNGIRISKAEAALARFAEATGIPVVTTATGKGVIAETHPMACGPFGTWGIESANFAALEADVVIVAGSKVGASDMNRENPALLDAERQTFVHIDIEPRNASWVYPAEHVLIGDAGRVLDQLREAIAPTAEMAQAGVKRVEQLRKDHGYFDRDLLQSDASPMIPPRLVAEMMKALPGDMIVTCDAGNNRFFMNHYLQTKAVGGILEPAGAGAMGYAIPAAMAAKLHSPNRQVVAVCGDGGFAMSMKGLISAIENRIPIIVVVMNNASLGAVVHDTGAYGALFNDFDHGAIARGIGCNGVRITDPAELGQAFKDAAASDKPTVIDVIISPESSFRECIAPPLGSLA